MTWFLDRPDVMAVYSTTITGDKAKYPVLLSNGNRVEEADLGDGRHRVRWEDPHPKPATCLRSWRATCAAIRAFDPRRSRSGPRDLGGAGQHRRV
ncbi:MAG: hypothetical protein R3F17_09170 [Planctomycetota bacterium]